MSTKLIIDSCGDLSEEIKERTSAVSVPLTVTMNGESHQDDEDFPKEKLLDILDHAGAEVYSGAPSPILYEENFIKDGTNYIITLSSKLSSSYASAQIAKQDAEEKGYNVHLIDSKSASAGELRVLIELDKLIKAGFEEAEIVASINKFVSEMKTYFVLENLKNLQKSGRLINIATKLMTVLNIRPIMGADDNGEIAFYSQARGEKKVLEGLLHLMEKSGKNLQHEVLVIAHCNNPELAEKLKNLAAERFHFQEIVITETRGIATMYAQNKGIIIAF